jgi:hypothetical protein
MNMGRRLRSPEPPGIALKIVDSLKSDLTEKTMKAITSLLTATWLLLVVFLAGCASSSNTVAINGASESSLQIMTFTETGKPALSFKAEGIIQDTGLIEGDLLPKQCENAKMEWQGTRVLRGEQGEIRLTINAVVTPIPEGDGVKAEGTVRIQEGTGAYADLTGNGRFMARTDSDGNPREWFFIN